MNLPLSPVKIKDGDQAVMFTDRVLSAVSSLPIRDASVTSALPLQGWGYGMPFQIVGKPVADRANRQGCFFKMVSPSYFRSLGIVLKQGRGFDAHDLQGGQPVAVINELMATKYFKGEDPIGRQIQVQEIVYGVRARFANSRT